MADELLKKVPFSLEAEQSVLGAILIDPEKFAEIVNIITSEDFYLEEHRQIYLAMQGLFLRHRTIDVVTLIDMLVESGTYDEKSSKAYIKLIAETVPSASNIVDYATIVKNKSTLRKLITATDEISDAAYSEADEVSDILDIAEKKIFEIARGNEQKGFAHIRDVLMESYDRLQLLQQNSAEAMGTPTGFAGIDRLLVGMGKGDLIIVGARPGMGKTSFVLNIAVNVAEKAKKTVCIFSLEMSNEQIVSRMLSAAAMVDSHTMRTGKLNAEEWEKIGKAAAALSETEIYIDDTGGITVTKMLGRLRRVKNLGLVIIDYLQLMQGENVRKSDNRTNEVSAISRGLKLMAKELGVPVICCAQLNRGTEGRSDKAPTMSDLRDSGGIEQDADAIMLIYRPEYYDKSEKNLSLARIEIAKHRHGETGHVDMIWLGQYTKFVTQENNYDDPNGA